MLDQCCNYWKQCCNSDESLYCTKNRRCKSSSCNICNITFSLLHRGSQRSVTCYSLGGYEGVFSRLLIIIRVACSRPSDSGDSAKKSEQGRTAWVAGQGRRFPSLFHFFSSAFFPSALHFVACENSRFSSLLFAACRTSLPAKRPNRRGAGRKGCFRRLSISHSLPSERPARLRKDKGIVKSVILICSQISTLQQQGVDRGCFSGQGCLSLDRSPQAPIQDLYVIGKVKKCSLLILLQKMQMSCYQSSFKIGTFIKAAVSKRNLITSYSF